MNTNAPVNPFAEPTTPSAAVYRGQTPPQAQPFADTLSRARREAPAAELPDETTLREAAGQLVAAAFVLPLLAEVRDSPLKTDLFGGGFAHDSMREQLDTQIAGRLTASPRFPLVDTLVDHFTRPRPVTPPAQPAFMQREANEVVTGTSNEPSSSRKLNEVA